MLLVGVVDRIEEGAVFIRLLKGQELSCPLSVFPFSVKEGMSMRISIELDHADTWKREMKAKRLIKDIIHQNSRS